jgi:putative ABC transport system permease protein
VDEGVVSWLGLALSLTLVAVAVAISLRERLRLEREMLVAVARSAVQLLLVALALQVVVDPDTPLAWSWLWVAGIVVFAAVTVARRAPELPGVLPVALTANVVTAAVALGLTFGLGIFPVEGRTVVPVAGMVVGNSMKSCVVVVQALSALMSDGRREIEARLALGLPGIDAARPQVRRALRLSIAPQVENVKALGIVFLPGAMTGLILAGVDPLDAVLVQLALMWIILGAVVVTTAATALAGTRRLFTPDQRLVVLARSARDE